MKIYRIAARPVGTSSLPEATLEWLRDADYENKTDADLARESGLYYQLIRFYREKIAPDTIGTIDRDALWRGTDWSKSDYVIGQEKGIPWRRVKRRRTIDPEGRRTLVPRPIPRPIPIDSEIWDTVDWENQTNGDIAKQLGCSVSAVSNQRGSRAPHTKRFHPGGKHRWDRIMNWNKPTKEIAQDLIDDLILRGFMVDADVTDQYRHSLEVYVSRKKQEMLKDIAPVSLPVTAHTGNWYRQSVRLGI